MYIRITRNKAGQAYYHFVESCRKDRKVKQRTLLSLGCVKEGKLEKLAKAISRHLGSKDLFQCAKDIDLKDTYIFGLLLVLDRMMEDIGIYKVLVQLQSDRKKLQSDFIKAIFTQICSRFVRPVSKLSKQSGY